MLTELTQTLKALHLYGVNGDSKLIQISFVQRFKTDTPPYPLTAR